MRRHILYWKDRMTTQKQLRKIGNFHGIFLYTVCRFITVIDLIKS